MANTELIYTDGVTDKLIREAMERPASEASPLVAATSPGVDDLELEVHVVATRWTDDGTGPTALALCGETLTNLAYGLVRVLPACWLCEEKLEGSA